MYLLILLFIFNIKVCNCFNILLFLIGTNQFERSTFEFLAQQLALRHHNTITVKPILIPEEPRLVQPRLHLVHEKILKNLLPRNLYEPLQTIRKDIPWRETYEIDAFNKPYRIAHNYSCEKMLNSNLMEVLAKDQIDVAIIYGGNPCQLAIVYSLGIPFIYFDLEGFTTETKVASGISFNYPTLNKELNFVYFLKRYLYGLVWLKERISQSGFAWAARMASKRYAELDEPITKLFNEDYEIRRKFKNNFPDVNLIKQQAELYFLNTDILLESSEFQYPVNVIPVGGIHIDTVKPLFSPWNDSITDANEGIIIVSLGTQVDTEKMPEKFVKALLNAFGKLKNFRIFWRIGPKLKLSGIENLENLPENINITTFLPQNELLANRRARLLISNGGMHSIMEALAYGIPILGIPLYGTNRENLEKIEQKGFGRILEKSKLMEKSLLENIQEMIYNTKYSMIAKELSKEYKNRPANAFERAIHLIEHVSRHRSAKFLRPNRNLILNSNMDILFFGFLMISISFYIAYLILRFQVQKFFRFSPKIDLGKKNT